MLTQNRTGTKFVAMPALAVALATLPVVVRSQASVATVPTTSANAPAAKASDDIKEISARAIEASQHDVEVVKFVFGAMSAVFALNGIDADLPATITIWPAHSRAKIPTRRIYPQLSRCKTRLRKRAGDGRKRWQTAIVTRSKPMPVSSN